jgi:hypothetical protein
LKKKEIVKSAAELEADSLLMQISALQYETKS